MKGVVFTTLLEMIEKEYGYDAVDQILTSSDLEHDGIYTSVGFYSHRELFQILSGLSKISGIEVEEHMKQMGHNIFKYFTKEHEEFISLHTCLFDFLESVELHIHKEVQKMYPEAELPRFITERIGQNHLKMTYISERKLGDFAYGIMEQAADYFEQPVKITQELINENGNSVLFHLIKEHV